MERMTLAAVRSTRREAPPRTLIYGGGGVGKSTFAANAPKPIFIASEDGLVNIDAQALPPPTTWAELLEGLDLLAHEAHDFETVAIDSLDWAEPLCWAHVCAKAYKPDIEAFGYGKGYLAALDEWRVLLHKLSLLRARGMHVVLIAHAVLGTVKNPEGDDYDRWSIKLQDSKKCSAAGLIYEWCDVVGFASHEVLTEDTSGRAKGVSTGRRILRTQPSAAFYAKTRYALPPTVTLDWATYAEAVKAGGPAAVERLRAELTERLRELGDVAVEKGALAYVRSRGETVPAFADAIARVNQHLAKKAS